MLATFVAALTTPTMLSSKTPVLRDPVLQKTIAKTGTDIKDCTNIANGGDYYLTNDVYNYRNPGICIAITYAGPSNVSIDCRGYKLVGLRSFDYRDEGIDTIGNFRAPLVVKNCWFINWYQPLSLRTSGSASINNTFYSNYYGIIVGDWYKPQEIANITILNNKINDTISNELVFHRVSNARLTDNDICAPPSGYYGAYNIYCADNSHDIVGSSQFSSTNCSLIKNTYDCVKAGYSAHLVGVLGCGLNPCRFLASLRFCLF